MKTKQQIQQRVEELFKTYSDYTALTEGHYEYLIDKESFKEALEDFKEWVIDLED